MQVPLSRETPRAAPETRCKQQAAARPDDCFHIGGDEVITGCWEDNAEVNSWMQQNGFNGDAALQYFEDQVAPIVQGANKNPVVWEDLFDNGIYLPSNYIVEASIYFD